MKKRVKRNQYAFEKDDQIQVLTLWLPDKPFTVENWFKTWKWDGSNEYNKEDIRTYGYDCDQAKIMLEDLVNPEYCLYITSKFNNYEQILKKLKLCYRIYCLNCSEYEI